MPRGSTRRTVLAAGVGAAITGAALSRPPVPSASSKAGRFVGERLAGGIACFLGIRYGRAARFQAPTPEPFGRSTVRAVAFGPAAPQRSKRGPQSEDCLFLNVWTPAVHSGAQLPVMIYIHGGAYAFGSATDPVCDGARLAEQGAVVVTVNHRLNALGYLYLARLDSHFPDSGNAGQLDLAVALSWVRDNIAAFGGDPTRITAFGDSGGGAKVTTLLAMPAAVGLIHRAATMSGQQVTVSGPLNATRRTRAYLAYIGVSEHDLSPLLTFPSERLLEGLAAIDPVHGGPLYFGPVLDHKNLLRHPFWPDPHPQSLAVPMMTGNARDEMRAFVDPDAPFLREMNWDNVAARIGDELPADVSPEWVVAEYRRQLPTASPSDIYFKATTDGRSWRGQLEVAEARARAGRPAWVYQVDFTSRADPRRGAFHCIDLPLLFGTFAAPGADTGSDVAVRRMSQTIRSHFLAFARHGDPNLAGAPAWPAYDLARRATMVFNVDSHVEDNPRAWQRELFARAPYRQPGS